MTHVHIAFCISLSLIVLGFVALLVQKTYLDLATNEPTAVDLPMVGKLKSNYPALVFVFFGFALAFYTFRTATDSARTATVSAPPKVEWLVKGAFRHPDSKKIDWNRGTLSLVPSTLVVSVSDRGTFEIRPKIEEGKNLEDIYEALDYTTTEGSIQIPLKREYQTYLKGEAGRITSATEHTRTYKPIDIELYPESKQ